MEFRRLITTGGLLILLAGNFAVAADVPANVMDTAPDATLAPEPNLQRSLRHVIDDLSLDRTVAEKHLAVSLVDITDIDQPRYAGINDREMMYAASLPKICALVAGFERIREGSLRYTASVKEMFTRMIRYSSNEDASRAIQTVGFDYISRVLTRYHLYDPAQNGGLWLGKAYGGPSDYWKRDPLHNISHGATTLQVARFFMMLQEGRLVSPEYSAEMMEILSKPGIHHKFVKGLDGTGSEIYRKSGTWSKYHADGALVKHDGKTYIAVALMEDPRGAEIFPKLIQKLDGLITNEPRKSQRAGRP
jgi:beta-lactamase class A